MSVGDYCNREVVVCDRDTSIREAARLMRAHHVGDLVVVRRDPDGNRPIGILTDRDLVIEVLAQEVDLDAIATGDVMSFDLATAGTGDDLWETLMRMRSLGLRRMPVVGQEGLLEGILTADDVLELLAEGMSDVARLARREIRQESARRR
ncbi:MAG TPA: CBS domain-containing protein [Gammaproteobacteria bacterium]|nr:CBS domain-containing protein [Gammaproteobacteria bacterium]